MKSQSGNIIYRNYSGYHSSFNKNVSKKSKKKKKSKSVYTTKFFAVAIVLAIIFSVPVYAYFHTNNVISKTVVAKTTASSSTNKTITTKPIPVAPAVQTQTTACSGNTLDKLMVASISQRRLWACQGSQIVYQTAVVTGDINVVEDATPVGTFHIYSKQTNLYLNGSDSRGSWHDYVNYWMPFLDNQYGVFGLHDATWRAASDFGNISPYSDNSSHGCIELPLAAAQWLFNWADIGTPVTIES